MAVVLSLSVLHIFISCRYLVMNVLLVSSLMRCSVVQSLNQCIKNAKICLFLSYMCVDAFIRSCLYSHIFIENLCSVMHCFIDIHDYLVIGFVTTRITICSFFTFRVLRLLHQLFRCMRYSLFLCDV